MQNDPTDEKPDERPDAKMELLCDPAIWQDAIDRRVGRKRMNPDELEALAAVSDTSGRAFLVQAIANGTYRIQPPRTLYVDKKTGLHLSYREAANRGFVEVRTLYAASSPLDGIVSAVVSAVYNRLRGGLIHPSCLSYQRGIGVRRIIHESILPRLKAGQLGYKVDISKYFDSVNRETLDATLETVFGTRDSPLDELVWDNFHDDHVFVNGELEARYMGIRQGNPLGTLLANLALRDVDAELSVMDVLYCRYADDALMVGPDADRALERMKEMLEPKGLSLNPKKVVRVSTDGPFTFLGCEIHGQRVDMSKESYDRVKREIRLICRPHKYIPKESRQEQVRAIRRINRLLRDGHAADRRVFGLERYFFSVVNVEDRIRELDRYIRDHVKGVYVGRQTQHRKAKALTSDEMLGQMGYKSLVRMYHASKCGPAVYNAEMLRVG